MKTSLQHRRSLRRLAPVWRWLLGLVVLLLLVVSLMRIVHWQAGVRLERWKEERRSRGEVLDLVMLMSNATVSDERQLSEFLAAAEAFRGFEGVAANVYPNWSLHAPGRAVPPWRRELDWARFDHEVEELHPALETLHTALAEPDERPLWDYRNPLSFPDTGLVEKRRAAQWLWRGVIDALRREELRQALRHLRALMGISRMQARQAHLVDLMIRAALVQMGVMATWAALQAEGWTEPLLEELAVEWREVSVLEQVSATMEFEQALGLFSFAMIRTNDAGTSSLFGPGGAGNAWNRLVIDPLWRMGSSQGDELHYLKTMQPFLDVARAAPTNRSWRAMQEALGDEDKGEPHSPLRFPYTFRLSRVLQPNYRKALLNLMQVETEIEMLRGAIALKRHELKHGRPPKSLGALVPELLEEPPMDGMIGEPLQYRVGTGGRWRLYSVGTNFVDDGGDGRWPGTNQVSDSLWEGRDAVWPGVTEPE